jgi:hypothetical protein
MSVPQPEHQGLTLAERETWEGRWELINGVAYDLTPAPSTKHQAVSVKLTLAIGNALEEAKRTTNGVDANSSPPPRMYFFRQGWCSRISWSYATLPK